MIRPLLSPAGIDRLRAALTAAGYTAGGIADRLGPDAVRAARRGDLRAALRATAQRDPLATLVRLYICGRTEPAAAVAAALPLSDALAGGLVEPHGDGYRAGVELEPYGDRWVVSDVSASLRPGQPLRPDHVLGVGAASTTLAQATVRRPVGAALDLGTGCGVQALHLSEHATRVTATDIDQRALRFAATTAALNGLDWDLRRGDLAAAVAGERFDLVVSNPPFVVGPGEATHRYRDSGRPGDAVCAELVASGPGLLNPGGVMQFLANWLHVAGVEWTDRVAGWLTGTGLDAWVIQREVCDPVGYVDLWLSDAGDDPARREAWLDWFDAGGVQAVGLGLVTLRAGGHDDPTVRIEDLWQAVEQPLGEQIAAWFDRQDWLRAHRGPELLDARLLVHQGLTLRQEATLGDDGWQVTRQFVTLPNGLRWTEELDPVALALLGGCDGRMTLRDQVDLLAVGHDVDPALLAEVAAPLAAHLIERGFARPVEA